MHHILDWFKTIFSNPTQVRNLIIVGILTIIVIIGSFDRRRFRPDKFMISLVFIFLLPGLMISLADVFMQFIHAFRIYKFIVIGAGAGIVFTILMRKFVGFSTFEHELAHAFMALLFFNRITSFVVTKWEGGYVSYSGGLKGWFFNHMISLAPYFLPLFLFVFVLIRPFMPAQAFPYYDIWVGMWFTYYLGTYFSEIRQNSTKTPFQSAGGGGFILSDIGKSGYIFSFIIILTMTAFLYGVIFNVIIHHYNNFLNFLKSIPLESLDFYKSFA